MLRYGLGYLYFVLFIFASGCASKVIITSEPQGASIYVRPQGSSDKVALGKTPFEITTEDLQKKAKVDPNSSDFFEVVLEKEGFQQQKLFIPPGRFGLVKTYVTSKMEATQTNRDVASVMVQHLFNSQKFAQKVDFERAHQEVDKALLLDPRFVRAISMKGTLFYLQSRYRESMTWYEKALEIDPQYEEAVRMLTALKTKLKEQP